MLSRDVGAAGLRILLALGCASLVGCATPVPLPVVATLAEADKASKLALVRKPLRAPEPLPSDFKEPPLRVGDRTIYGIVLTPELEKVSALQAAGRLDEAVDMTAAAERGVADAMMAWYLAAHRTHLLNLAGRAPEAESAAEVVRQREIALRGSDLVARTLRGDARARLGEYERAIADYLSVLSALGGWTFPTSYSGPPSNLTDLVVTTEARTRALLGMSFVYTITGRHELALAWAEETERHMADLFHVSRHPLYGALMGRVTLEFYMGRAVNLAFLGTSHLATGSTDAVADPFFAAAASYFAAMNYAHGPVHVLALKAMGYLHAGRIDDAERLSGEAAIQAARSGLVDFVWRIEALKAEALLAAGRKADAETSFRSAQLAVDRITGLIGSDREKRRFGVGKDDITYRLAQLDFERGDADQLFRDLERGRARAFVDMLATVKVAAGDPDVEAIRAIDRQAKVMVSAIEAGRRDSADGTPATRKLAVEPGTMDPLVRDRAAAVERLRRRAPALADTKGIGDADPGQIRQALQADELLVYFLPTRGGDAVRALMFTRDKSWLKQLRIGTDALAAELSAFAAAVEAHDAAAQVAIGLRLSEAFEVASWRAYGAVLVVPSGLTHTVPWGATEVAVPVVVVPTGSWPTSRNFAKTAAAPRAVVVGDPDFQGRAEQLPGARIEATRVAALYGVQAILGGAATESALRAAVGQGTDVLHLATHGKYFGSNPLRSAIYLTGAVPLTAAGLFENPLPAGLVVLSACETGIGQAEAGDDFLGIPRSLYLGGTRAVLSSLWPVDDDGTLAFMETFHREAGKGDLGRAWLAARDSLKRAGHAPWIYGAFQLGGSR